MVLVRPAATRPAATANGVSAEAAPVHTIAGDALAGEAMLLMLERNLHHLPVVARGVVVGVVTDSDLMDLDRGSPFAIRGAIGRASTTNEVVFAARGFPAVVARLVEAGADPMDAARVISVIGDAATARLLTLATDDLGDPPCSFAWLALGSAARHERAMDSDQDHALAFGEL